MVARRVGDLAEAHTGEVGAPHAHPEIGRRTQRDVVQRQRHDGVRDGVERFAQPAAVVGGDRRVVERDAFVVAEAQQRRFRLRVALTGEGEQARASGAGCFEREPEAHIAEPPVVLQQQGVEGGGLVGVSEPQDNVVDRWGTGLEGPHGLQHGGHAEPAVVGVHRGRNRVEVAQQQHAAGAVGARDAGDDVAEPAGEHLVEVVAGGDPLHHLGLHAEFGQTVADGDDRRLMLGGSHRAGLGGDGAQLDQGPIGGEHVGWCARRLR